jgi:hypothetical protein
MTYFEDAITAAYSYSQKCWSMLSSLSVHPVPFVVFPCNFCGDSEERGLRVIAESRVDAYVHYGRLFLLFWDNVYLAAKFRLSELILHSLM